MLSRAADALYWMCRYAERAENVARFLDVSLQVILDLPDAHGGWANVVAASRTIKYHLLSCSHVSDEIASRIERALSRARRRHERIEFGDSGSTVRKRTTESRLGVSYRAENPA